MKKWVMENKLNIKEYLDKDEQKDLLRLLTAGSVDEMAGKGESHGKIKKDFFWKIGVKIFIFGLAIYAVIPVSVHVSKMIYSTYQESIDATIDEANDLADESEAAKDDDKDSKKSKDSESSFIDKAKDAVNSVKNTLSVTADSVKNMVNKFIDGLAVLIVTTCLIPVLVIVFFIWLVKLVLGSAISSPGAVAMRRGKDK